MINDFHKQLADSESSKHDLFWDTAYKRLFSDTFTKPQLPAD